MAVAASSGGPSSSLKETAAVDELIDLLLRAKNNEEVSCEKDRAICAFSDLRGASQIR